MKLEFGGEAEQWQSGFETFPAGYRFKPTEEELVVCYLLPKLRGAALPPNVISDLILYDYDPESVQAMMESSNKRNDDEWYFFTPRIRRYKNGGRPKRTVPGGYWKATGREKKIFSDETLVGLKISLVFYRGCPRTSMKTNFIIHEYRAHEPERTRSDPNDMELDHYVLCRMFKKKETVRVLRNASENGRKKKDDATKQ